MNVRLLEPRDRDQWIELRRALWPDYPAAHIQAEADAYLTTARIVGVPSIVLLAEEPGRGPIGFAEISLRPYARGCVTTPVGYLEGWYVDPDFRRRGIGKALVAAGEDWARAQGCSEFASDRDEANLVSRAAHLALRFNPADHCEQFRKPLIEDIAPASDFIGIVDFDLNVGTITNLVHEGAAGGIAIFLGTTRAEMDANGQELLALDYETYEAMAIAQLKKLAADARSRWPIIKLAILHRVGQVKIAEPSVIIAVSTPHRADAFEACRFIIDQLKKDIAIWKKEVWSDGSGTWVHPIPASDK